MPLPLVFDLKLWVFFFPSVAVFSNLRLYIHIFNIKIFLLGYISNLKFLICLTLILIGILLTKLQCGNSNYFVLIKFMEYLINVDEKSKLMCIYVAFK